MLPKLVITDIDGVWTDGGMYYDKTGNELKKFNTSDSVGVMFLQILNIPTCIITSEDTEIVALRAKKLHIDYVLLGIKNKLQAASQLLDKLNLSFADVAFIGDDINDIPLLKKVGESAVPITSPSYIQEHAHTIIPCGRGEGVFRKFVEHILSKNNILEHCIDKMLEHYVSDENNII